MILLSKELLSEVLGYEVFNFRVEGNYVIINDKGDYDACSYCYSKIKDSSACSRVWHCSNDDCKESGDYEFYPPIYNFSSCEEISIYELEHLCKEWIKKQGSYEIIIQTYPNVGCRLQLQSRDEEGFKCFIHDEAGTLPSENLLEPEAVFKATQYVYNKLKEK